MEQTLEYLLVEMKVGLEKQGALHAKMHVNQQKKDANLE
jgi:hypothetical protein